MNILCGVGFACANRKPSATTTVAARDEVRIADDLMLGIQKSVGYSVTRLHLFYFEPSWTRSEASKRVSSVGILLDRYPSLCEPNEAISVTSPHTCSIDATIHASAAVGLHAVLCFRAGNVNQKIGRAHV